MDNHWEGKSMMNGEKADDRRNSFFACASGDLLRFDFTAFETDGVCGVWDIFPAMTIGCAILR